jgi:hypothetical protein
MGSKFAIRGMRVCGRIRMLPYAHVFWRMQVRGMRRAELTFELSESSRCIPEEGRKTCVDYSFIVFTSDGPLGDKFKVSLDELEKRSCAPTGDPQLREINLMRVCIDRSWFPDFVTQVLSLLALLVQKYNN